MKEKLYVELSKHGYKGHIISIQHLNDLQNEIKDLHRKSYFNEEFYKFLLSHFNFNPPKKLPDAKSLIVVAVPNPQIQVIFNWQGKKLPVKIPPTYVGYIDTYIKVENLLMKILGKKENQVIKANLPNKLLAVHSGLGYYGRNNICHISNMGSFVHLSAFYTDLQCQEDNWQELQQMKRCLKCSACIRNCPTGAITEDRFLLHAERCITFYNERIGDFPNWIDPNWHNCLVGCLECQIICPENKDLLEWIEVRGEFSQDETTLLLEKERLNQLPSRIQMKLKKLDLIEYFNVLSRNLNALFHKENKTPSL